MSGYVRKVLFLLAAAGLALAAGTVTPAGAASTYSTQSWFSTYTWSNNSPPGCGIEYARDYGYPTVHNCAGGTGSYADPITFAAQPGQWGPPGTRIWIPFFKRYFMLEDVCSTCYTSQLQGDLWAGMAPDNSYAANYWDYKWVEVNPPPGLPCICEPLYP